MAAFLRGDTARPLEISERPFALVVDDPASGRMFARRLRLGDGGWPAGGPDLRRLRFTADVFSLTDGWRPALRSPLTLVSDGSGEEVSWRRRRREMGAVPDETIRSALEPGWSRRLSGRWSEEVRLFAAGNGAAPGASGSAAAEGVAESRVIGESGWSGAIEVDIYGGGWSARSKMKVCPSAWL